jgi:hypothetical protein
MVIQMKPARSSTPQPVAAPLTRAAIFLVATLNPGLENRATLRSFCGDLSALSRAVEFRDLKLWQASSLARSTATSVQEWLQFQFANEAVKIIHMYAETIRGLTIIARSTPQSGDDDVTLRLTHSIVVAGGWAGS